MEADIPKDPMYEEFTSLIQRLVKKEITVHEYCKMADDIMTAYTTIRWPLHLKESYTHLPPELSSEEDEEDFILYAHQDTNQ